VANRLRMALLFLLLPAAVANAAIAVMGPLLMEYDVKPGGSYEGSIVVQNSGDAPQEIKVYQTDYRFSADGRADYGEPAGGLPRSNAKWITLSPTRVSIPAGESTTIGFAVQVPDSASLTGTYWSLIMVEPVDASSPESSSSKPDSVSLSVRQVFRYAIQIATTVGSTGSVQARFDGFHLDQADGKRDLQIDVENTGDRLCPTTVWAEVYDANGKFVGKFDAGQRRLDPGTSARFTADLTSIAAANYKALILVDCGGNNVFGANANLVFTP